MACQDCAKPAPEARGSVWAGEPSGKEVKVHGMDVYIAEPAGLTTGKAVLMIPEVNGWDAKNNRLFADKLAAIGLTVALPDFFHGDKPDLEAIFSGDYSGFMAWRERHGAATVLPDAQRTMNGLRSEHGAKSIGVIGMCWGGKYALMLGAGDEVKAVVVNHGSFVEEGDVAGVKQPTMLNGSDNDQQISREQLDTFASILTRKAGMESDVKFFDGSFHGWTVRGDDKDPKMAPLIVEAFDRARDWFLKHL